MRPHETEVNGIVGEIWSAMLDLEVAPDDRASSLSEFADATSSCVRIAGTWQGTVGVHCGPELAANLASIMFGRRPELLSPEMISDALGEITNMISGCIKSLLPGPCTLSLPMNGPALRPRAAGGSRRFGFRCGRGRFLITLDEGKAAPEGLGPTESTSAGPGTNPCRSSSILLPGDRPTVTVS